MLASTGRRVQKGRWLPGEYPPCRDGHVTIHYFVQSLSDTIYHQVCWSVG